MSLRIHQYVQTLCICIIVVGIAMVAMVTPATADSGGSAIAKTLDRDLEPVVVTGAQVGAFSDTPVPRWSICLCTFTPAGSGHGSRPR